MDNENENINIEDGATENSNTDSKPEEEETSSTGSDTEEEDTADDDVEEDDEDEGAYKDKTRKRFEKLTSELGEARTSNKRLEEKIDLLSQTIEKLTSKDSTEEEKEVGLEILQKIRKIDEDGFTSYEDLAKLVSEYVQLEINNKAQQQKKQEESTYTANVKELQGQLADLVSTDLLKKEEQSEFIKWCADQLDATTTEENPQGNVKIYGDFYRALPYYRKFKSVSAGSADQKKQLERSATPPSGGSSKNSVKEVSLEELSSMSLLDAMKIGRSVNK